MGRLLQNEILGIQENADTNFFVLYVISLPCYALSLIGWAFEENNYGSESNSITIMRLRRLKFYKSVITNTIPHYRVVNSPAFYIMT